MIWRKKKVIQDTTIIPNSFKLGTSTIGSKNSSLDIPTQIEFRTTVLKWCIQNSFLIIDPARPGENIPVVNIQLENRLLQRAVFNLNFNALLHGDNFENFYKILQDTDTDYTHARILSLYLYITTYIDSEFINRYVNKWLSTLKKIGVQPVPGGLTWDEIFKRCPEIWIIYAIQVEMHEVTTSFSSSDK